MQASDANSVLNQGITIIGLPFPSFLWDALRDFVPFLQLKNHLTLLKVTLLHGCFSHFLNCTNGTKSYKASHM